MALAPCAYALRQGLTRFEARGSKAKAAKRWHKGNGMVGMGWKDKRASSRPSGSWLRPHSAHWRCSLFS